MGSFSTPYSQRLLRTKALLACAAAMPALGFAPAALAQSVEARGPPGQDLVDVALMAGVEDDGIVGPAVPEEAEAIQEGRKDVGSDRKPPLALALSGERRHRARRRSSDEHHPLFRKFTHAVPLAVDAVARAFA